MQRHTSGRRRLRPAPARLGRSRPTARTARTTWHRPHRCSCSKLRPSVRTIAARAAPGLRTTPAVRPRQLRAPPARAADSRPQMDSRVHAESHARSVPASLDPAASVRAAVRRLVLPTPGAPRTTPMPLSPPAARATNALSDSNSSVRSNRSPIFAPKTSPITTIPPSIPAPKRSHEAKSPGVNPRVASVANRLPIPDDHDRWRSQHSLGSWSSRSS